MTTRPTRVTLKTITLIDNIWDKVFKSGLSNFCGRQPLKNLLSPLLNTLSHIINILYF